LDFNANFQISTSVSDGAASVSGVKNVIGTAVNDAPTASAPASYAATEQTALDLKNSGLLIADVDAASGTMTLTLNVAAGVLNATAGGSGATVSGSATDTVTITGNINQINDLLNSDATSTLSYLNSSDTPPASVALTLSVSDGGNTGSGGTLTGNAVSTINISAVNDAPVLANTATLNYTENAAATAIHSAITVADVDNGTLSSATVSITGNFAAGQDVLGFTNVAMGNISISSNAGGVLTLSSAGATATLAQWQAALRAVTYSNSSDNPSTLARTVSFVVNDGAASSNIVTATVNVAAVNDPAIIAGTTSGAVTEADGVANGTLNTPTAAGTLTATDPDDPANTFAAVGTATASTGGFGTFTMTAGGAWTYTLNNADVTVEALNNGQTLADSFTVITVDGTPQTINITINGSNDNAIVAGAISGAVTEAGGVANGTLNTPTATGVLTATDVDNPANSFNAQASTVSTGGYGSFTMSAGGTWLYTLDNANATVQALNNGQTLADSFVVTTVDGTAQTVSITINGADDAPVITSNGGGAAAAVSVAENSVASVAVTTVTASDADGPALTYSIAGGADAGLFSIHPASGVLTFNTAPDFEAPADAGGNNVYDVTVQVSDGTLLRRRPSR
jgi:VCBS repeat-containing protein